MRSALRALSTRSEALIVLVGAFGYPLFSAGYYVTHPSVIPHITQRHLEFLLVYEPLFLFIWGAFLYVRGWTVQKIGLIPGVKDSLIGIGIAVAAYAGYVCLWIALSEAHLQPAYLAGTKNLVEGPLDLLTVIAASIVNPVFEEVFVCGYIVTLAKERGRLALGVNASVGLRLAYHLYQGGAGVASIVPFGLICAWWYARTGRLWPVIVAHAAVDVVSLSSYVN